MGRSIVCIGIHANGRFAPFVGRDGGGKWALERGTESHWVVVIEMGQRLLQQGY